MQPLLREFPALFAVKPDGNGGGDRPAHRPCEPDTDGALCQVGQEKRQNHAQRQVCESGCHKLPHGADAPENTVRDQLGGYNKIERRQNPQKLPSRQHSRCRVSFHEQKEQIFSEKNIEGAEGNAQAPHHFDAGTETVFQTAVFSGAQILCGKIGNTVSDRSEGGNNQIV